MKSIVSKSLINSTGKTFRFSDIVILASFMLGNHLCIITIRTIVKLINKTEFDVMSS